MTRSTDEPSRVFDLATTPIEGGTTVIEASAGTGKTYCLVGLAIRLLLEERVDGVGQLLLVTFTNAAADELAVRLRSALRETYEVFADPEPPDDPSSFLAALLERHGGASPDDPQRQESAARLRRALLDFDEIAVSTIHGFCRRVLEEAAFESGLGLSFDLLDADAVLLPDALRDVWRRLVLAPSTEPLLAGLVAAEGWTPDAFLDDLRAARRHPSTRVLPAPDLEESLAALRTARDRLAGLWSKGRFRHALGKLPWRRSASTESSPADPAVRRALLDALDAFCAGHADALDAALRCSSDRLEPHVERSAHDELRTLPVVVGCDAVARAAETVGHALRARLVAEVDDTFERLKERAAVLGFDDLPRRLDEALRGPNGHRLRRAVRARWRAALIDEFQDTDLVQYRIFRALFGRDGDGATGDEERLPLILVGDPKQAIYRFRGADVFAYLAARREADRIYDLGRNWRSARGLVAAVNAVFSTPRPFVVEEIPFRPVEAAEESGAQALIGPTAKSDDGALVWRWLGDATSVARGEARAVEAVADDVARLLADDLLLVDDPAAPTTTPEPLAPRHVAILVRTNRQATAVQEALRARGVPAVVGRSGDVFRTEEAAEVERLLAAIVDPRDAGLVRGACATRLWGDDADALRRLADDVTAWQARVELFDDLLDVWRRKGFPTAVRRLLDERAVHERLLARPGGERRLTNVLHLVELLDGAIHERRLSPTGLLGWLRAERAVGNGAVGHHERSSPELRLESDAEAVTIATMHKAKGLEWEVVLCPFLWQGRPVTGVPVEAHVDLEHVVLDYGSDALEDHRALAEAERLAEDLRLTYVALTRARRRAYAYWGAIGRGRRPAAAALAYLLHRRQETLPTAIGELTETAAARIERLDDMADRRRAWRGDLARFVDRNDSMSLRDVDDAWAPRYRDPSPARRRLEARPLPAGLSRQLRPWRVQSFTGLTRDATITEAPERADPSLPPDTTASEAVESSDTRPDDASLLVFARGARAGSCLHEVFERVDFTSFRGGAPTERAGIERVVAAALRRHGLDDPRRHRQAPPGWTPEAAVVATLERVLRAPIPGAGFRLADVDRAHRLVEWQFYAPLEATPAELADDFRRHAAEPWRTRYPRRLEQLGSSRLEGFLTGFVDLVFEHDGSWWIVDWKSNHLGARPVDYAPEALAHAMESHDYVLQAHLYALALHRFLAGRLPEYEPERHLGGVAYVFLRGVGLGRDASTGWWIERPPAALLRAMESRLFPGGGEDGR